MEVACVGALVGPDEFAEAVFHADFVVAGVGCAVCPHFFAVALLLVFHPVALVLRTVHVLVEALPVGFVCLPLADVDVPGGVDEPPVA